MSTMPGGSNPSRRMFRRLHSMEGTWNLVMSCRFTDRLSRRGKSAHAWFAPFSRPAARQCTSPGEVWHLLLSNARPELPSVFAQVERRFLYAEHRADEIQLATNVLRPDAQRGGHRRQRCSEEPRDHEHVGQRIHQHKVSNGVAERNGGNRQKPTFEPQTQPGRTNEGIGKTA